MILDYTLLNDIQTGFTRLDVVSYLVKHIAELSRYNRQKEMLLEIDKDYLSYIEKEKDGSERDKRHYLYCNIDDWLKDNGIQYHYVKDDIERVGSRGMTIEKIRDIYRLFIRDIGVISYLDQRDSSDYTGDDQFNFSVFIEGTKEELTTLFHQDIFRAFDISNNPV